MMAGIRGKNTRPEMIIRRGLHAMGYRYRLHDCSLPGRPDLVFAGRRAVIFVNGCFWHGHDCHLFRWPKTRIEFWRDKISGNVHRDSRVRAELLTLGWRIGDVWECALKGRERMPVEDVLGVCSAFLKGDTSRLDIGGKRTVEIDTGNHFSSSGG
jgi:DNA mismatch endonuclease (patch repair protein)